MAANLSPHAVVVWNQTELKGATAVDRALITVIVSYYLYAKPGINQLFIKDKDTGAMSDAFSFAVYE